MWDALSSLLVLSLAGGALCCLLIVTRPSQAADTIQCLPTSLPVVGDLPEVVRHFDRMLDWVSTHCLQFHGRPWRLRITGQSDAIIFCTPDAFEDVLIKQFDNFPHGEALNNKLRQLLGDSILTTDGKQWFHQRKTAAKFFTSQALRQCMLTTMRKTIGQLQAALDQSIDNQRPVDLTNLLLQYTLQTFTETGLGVNLEWIGNDEPHPFETFVRTGSTAVSWRVLSPEWAWRLQRWLGIGVEGEFLAATKATRVWFQTVVKESLAAAIDRQRLGHHQSQPDKTNTRVKSVVELFLEYSTDDTIGLRHEDLVDFLLGFVLAAQDTSALTMSWLFFYLTKHPDVEQRIRDEMAMILPSMSVNIDTYLTTDHVHKLMYLEATIREVLRLYPIVPSTRREVCEDTVVCGNIPLRAGEVVMLSMHAMARNPTVWGPDAAQFKPSRWINAITGKLVAFPPTKFATFGAGPRTCIGMKLAMLELRVTVANLLHRYRFALSTPNDGSYAMRVTFTMEKPLMMRVKRV